MSPIAIRIEDIEFRYPSRRVLDGVAFEVEKGQLATILGPNGSGKTTLLRSISGFLKPQSGCVYLEGTDLADLSAPEIARRLAVVTQSPPFDFPFTVFEYVMMGRSPHIRRFQRETRDDHKSVEDALEMTGLSSLEGRPVTELSGGEQRRVAIARALAQEPLALLLDEPTAGLDINYQVSVMALLRTLARQRSMTILAVLHDINLASSYCDQVILMSQGTVHAAGLPKDVITPECIAQVYGSQVTVMVNPETRRPFVLPARRAVPLDARLPSVFVVGGGGSAAGVLAALAADGVRVTAGVLNAGDADWLTCRTLGIEVVEEEPFNALSQPVIDQARSAARTAGVVVLTDVPFGPGNLANLQLVKDMLGEGKQVIVIGKGSTGARDYCGGKAKAMLDEIVGMGAVCVDDDSLALEVVRRYA